MPKNDPNFEVYNKLFNEWVEKFGLMKAKEINETTYNNLRKNLMAQISEALELGETPRQIKNRILEVCEGVYENMDKARATLIARNESMQSVNTGTFITAQAEGVKTKEFLATPDSRTRDAHAEADGQVVGINEPFIVGGEELMYPGDPSGSAENTISCRCTMLLNF